MRHFLLGRRQFGAGATSWGAAVGAAGVGSGNTRLFQATTRRPVLLELFTSQGCSSCPPADALLRDLAQSRTDVLALSFHVTYWNYLGWPDPFSFEGATQRQRVYAGRISDGTVYTPQLVVDGTADIVGTDRAGVMSAIARAAVGAVAATSVALRREGDTVVTEIADGAGSGAVFLVGYDPEHRTSVGRGENGGRTLLEGNIVRSFAPAAMWTGAALRLRTKRPDGARIAAFIQAADGQVLAVGRESGDAS